MLRVLSNRLLVLILLVTGIVILLLVQVIPGFQLIVITVTPPKRTISIIEPTPTSPIKPTVIITTSVITPPSNEALEYARTYLEFKVDREFYKLGDKVKITIINHGDKTIEMTNPPWAIYKYTGKDWVKVYTPPCRVKTTVVFDIKKGREVEMVTHETITIKPECSVSWVWNLKVYGELVTPGRYAITLRDDIFIKVNGKSFRMLRIGGLVRSNLEEPIVYFTVEES